MATEVNEIYAWAIGKAVKATATAGTASAEVQIRTVVAPALGVIQPPLKILVKSASSAAGPGIHVAFGVAGMAAPTANDMVVGDADGWLRVLLQPPFTHFRIFCEGSSAGSVYILPNTP